MKNKKSITQKSFVDKWFAEHPYDSISCVELTKKLIEEFKLTGNIAHYKAGSISSLLRKLVQQNHLKYAGETKRGGHLYKLNIDNLQTKNV